MDVSVSPPIASRVKRLETADVSRLDPLRFGNPREMAPADKEALRTSVRTLGYAEPIVVREVPGTDRLEVVDGHHRLQVLQEEKVLRVPVVVVDLNDVEARALVLASGGNVRARWTEDLQDFIEGMVADGASLPWVAEISKLTANDAAVLGGVGADFLDEFQAAAPITLDDGPAEPSSNAGRLALTVHLLPQESDLVHAALAAAKKRFKVGTTAEALVSLCGLLSAEKA